MPQAATHTCCQHHLSCRPHTAWLTNPQDVSTPLGGTPREEKMAQMQYTLEAKLAAARANAAKGACTSRTRALRHGAAQIGGVCILRHQTSNAHTR